MDIVTFQSSRALYLDAVENCSSASCVNMLNWFIDQYCTQRQVLSDNSNSFTSKEFKEFIFYMVSNEVTTQQKPLELLDFLNGWCVAYNDA